MVYNCKSVTHESQYEKGVLLYIGRFDFFIPPVTMRSAITPPQLIPNQIAD